MHARPQDWYPQRAFIKAFVSTVANECTLLTRRSMLSQLRPDLSACIASPGSCNAAPLAAIMVSFALAVSIVPPSG